MVKRLVAIGLLLAVVAGGLLVTARAQTIGCGNSIFGSLVLITSANAQTINNPCGSGGPHIALSATTIVAGSANGTTLGTASIVGTVTGTASWSLTDVSGTFQINSSTGVVTVLSNTNLTSGNTIPITISVSGVTPTVPSAPFTITVVSNCSGTVDLSTGCAQAMLGAS